MGLTYRVTSERVPDLIDSVKRRPSLFNFDCSRRLSEIDLRAQLWSEVAEELSLSMEDCKADWIRLRSQLRLEQRTLSSGKPSCGFEFYDQMQHFVPLMNMFSSVPLSTGDSGVETAVGSVKRKGPAQPKSVKQMRLSLTTGLQQYKQRRSAANTKPKRRSYPITSSLTADQSPIIPEQQSHQSEGISERENIASHPKHSNFRKQTQNLTSSVTDNHIFKEPSAASSVMSSAASAVMSVTSSSNMTPPHKPQSALSAAGSKSERTTLQEYTEYNFVIAMLQILDDIPVCKRNIVKAKIMANIATAYDE